MLVNKTLLPILQIISRTRDIQCSFSEMAFIDHYTLVKQEIFISQNKKKSLVAFRQTQDLLESTKYFRSWLIKRWNQLDQVTSVFFCSFFDIVPLDNTVETPT